MKDGRRYGGDIEIWSTLLANERMGALMSKIVVGVSLVVLGLAVGAPEVCEAQETGGMSPAVTRVMIRVVSRDAKIIGSGVGGVQVRVVDAKTGEVLAEGKQEGGTGDTQRIMSSPRGRGMKVFDTAGAAGFLAELRLNEPTIVNISAVGPLGHPQATQSATKQMLIMPGGHVEGDGVILELHGFIVEILQPEPLVPAASTLNVRARVRMMCGCPLTPGGMWNSDRIAIEARLWADGKIVARAPLSFAGEASMFSGELAVPSGQSWRDVELEVSAAQPETQNFGHHVVPLGAR